MNALPPLIVLAGPFGPILSILATVVVLLTGRAVWMAAKPGTVQAAVVREQANAILFWGSAASVLGFLGQCQGTYSALRAIVAATELSPNVVAEGFVISFLPALMGFGILAFALVAWTCLRFLPLPVLRSPGARTPAFFLLLMLGLPFPARGQVASRGPQDITQGVWVFHAGASDFLWEFSRDPGSREEGVAPGRTVADPEGKTPGKAATDPEGETPGRAATDPEVGTRSGVAAELSEAALGCVVHDIQDGLEFMETPCQSASFDGEQVVLTMASSGVRYEGSVDLAGGEIQGRLLYPNGGSMEVNLKWAPRSEYPALDARPNADGPYSYNPPEARDDGWPVGDARTAGVDPTALERAVNAIARGDAGLLKSFLVARGGTLILEEYFHGYGSQDLVPIRSSTKSISSLLVGLAIQEGHISGVDVPLLDFFPNQRDQAGSGWGALTLEHLLTMSLALDWAPPQTQDLHGTGPEAFRQILARNVEGQPGQDFEYVNMNVNLLAGVLKEATGEQAEALAERGLFRPLGITRWDWEDMKTDGFNLMDGSLRLRPRDMARIGVMVGQGGTWKGQRILDESWIRASLEPRLSAGTRGEGYGYLWWTMPVPGPHGHALQVIFANGWGSQFILMIPELDLVVVTTGGNMENGKHLAVGDVLIRDIIPGVSSGG